MKKSLLLLSVVAIGSLHGMQAGSMSDNESGQARTGRAIDQFSAALQILRDHGLDTEIPIIHQDSPSSSSESSDAAGERVTLPFGYVMKLATVLQRYTQQRAASSQAQINNAQEPVYTFSATRPQLTRQNLIGVVPEIIDVIIENLKLNAQASFLLLLGDPGVGKTTIAEAIAGETQRDFYAFAVGNLGGCYAGHGAKKIKDLFEFVRQEGRPAIIFLDEVHGIAREPKNSNSNEEAKLLGVLNVELEKCLADDKNLIYVIAATPNNDNLDEAFLSRMAIPLTLSLPNWQDRKDILYNLITQSDSRIRGSESIRTNKDRENLAKTIASKTNAHSKRDLRDIIINSQLFANVDSSSPCKGLLLEKHFIKGMALVKMKRALKKGMFSKYCTAENGWRVLTTALTLYQMYQAAKHHSISHAFQVAVHAIGRQDRAHDLELRHAERILQQALADRSYNQAEAHYNQSRADQQAIRAEDEPARALNLLLMRAQEQDTRISRALMAKTRNVGASIGGAIGKVIGHEESGRAWGSNICEGTVKLTGAVVGIAANGGIGGAASQAATSGCSIM